MLKLPPSIHSKQEIYDYFNSKLEEVIAHSKPSVNQFYSGSRSLVASYLTNFCYHDLSESSLKTLTDYFVWFGLNRQRPTNPIQAEFLGSHLLLLTGYFQSRQSRQHNLSWYSDLATQLLVEAARHPDYPYNEGGQHNQHMIEVAAHIVFWRNRLRDLEWMIRTDAFLLPDSRMPRSSRVN